MTQRRILLVEDDVTNIRLVQEVLRESRLAPQIDVVCDGEQALAFLRQQGEYAQARRPDIVLLDFDLPRKNGRDVLAEVKQDSSLCTIPVIMFTSSMTDLDMLECYSLQASSCIIKPVDAGEFARKIKSIEDYWFNAVCLPSRRQ